MQIREFSERVLFGATLADKFFDPGRLQDSAPGAAIATPEGPGRPAGLGLDEQASRARVPFPKLHELDRATSRGHLFHFFANHELLALELMALALLKLPDAPPKFRLGVARTMFEEQTHLRLYLERMRGCGVELGEIPLNAYFWRCSAGMTSPMDYVTQLSLTFEQANLDYCLHYRCAFETIDDTDSVAVLDRVCEDEVGHLQFGLDWFNKWRERGAQETEFEAYRRYLKPPLTPIRAKGFTFNREARLRAGLSEQFVDELRVFSTSSGRPPHVYSYNPPDADEAEVVQHDLATLPMFVATADDVVLVRERPRPEFLRSLQQAGFSLPEFVAVADPSQPFSTSSIAEALDHRRLGELRPWSSERDPYSASACAEINDAFLGANCPDWVQAPSLAQCVGENSDVCHLAVAFTVHASGAATVHGLTRFVTDEQGVYLGSLLGNVTKLLGGDLARAAHGDGRAPGRLFDYLEAAASFAATALAKTGYVGPAGIDATLYDKALTPIARVYPRQTMGRVALAINRRLERGHVGLWTVVRRPDIASFAAEMQRRFPIELNEHGDLRSCWGLRPQVQAGVLFTTDPARARACATAIIAGRTWRDCAEPLAEFCRESVIPRS